MGLKEIEGMDVADESHDELLFPSVVITGPKYVPYTGPQDIAPWEDQGEN